MGWLSGLSVDLAEAIVLGALGVLITGLIGVIVAGAPKDGTVGERVRGAIRRRKVLSFILAGVLVVSGAVYVAGSISRESSTEEQPAFVTPEAATPSPSAPTPAPSASFARAGWGPARPLVLHDLRQQGASLNSMVDNPIWGDERNFTRVRAVDAQERFYDDSVVVEVGKTYEFVVGINNDAADDGEAAEGVHLRLQMPREAIGSARTDALISSSNTTPETIWDSAVLIGSKIDEKFALNYVGRSAVLHSAGGDASGTVLSDDVFGDGVLIGCDALDGNLPAGQKCQSWVTFQIRVDRSEASASAWLKQEGTPTWGQTAIVQAGATYNVLLEYKNRGTTQQDDVTLRANLPSNMYVVKGSVKWTFSRGSDVPIDDGKVDGVGVNVGSYNPNGNCWIVFDVVMGDPSDLSGTVQTIEDFLSVSTSDGNSTAPLTLVFP